MPTPATAHKGSDFKSAKSGAGGKPIMRGLHIANTMRNIYTALGLAATAGMLVYFFVGRRRKNAYKEFHSSYDADASFARMVEAGVLDSAVESKKKK